jgi:endonuclease YncB( thermonuclease family)
VDGDGGHTCKTNCSKYGLSYKEYHYHPERKPSSRSTKSDKKKTYYRKKTESYQKRTYNVDEKCNIDKPFSGKVVGISDGDTITVLCNNQPVKIRLYGIDTPEKRQDFGTKAKQFTANFAFDKLAIVYPETIDKYGRTIAIVEVNNKNLNESLVANGYAWVYRKYCKKSLCQKLLLSESEARKSKLGLWSHKNPIKPENYRRGIRQATNLKFNNVNIQYNGNQRSKIFHLPGCDFYDCKNCPIVFHSKDEAIQNGYKPCSQGKP